MNKKKKNNNKFFGGKSSLTIDGIQIQNISYQLALFFFGPIDPNVPKFSHKSVKYLLTYIILQLYIINISAVIITPIDFPPPTVSSLVLYTAYSLANLAGQMTLKL